MPYQGALGYYDALLEMPSPPNFASGLQAANSAPSFRGLALLSLNPCLMLASCRHFKSFTPASIVLTASQSDVRSDDS